MSYKMLDVPVTYQQQSNWCWVAAAQMIIRFLRPEYANVTQGDVLFATTHEYRNRFQNGADPLGRFGLRQTVVMAPISYQDLKNEIDAGRPVQADITWKSGNGNHVTLIVGYIEIYGTQQLMIWEPIDGWLFDPSGNAYTYSAFTDNARFRWHMTRYQITQ